MGKYGRLDVVVNNAGYGVLGVLEEIPMSDIRQQFEVNVFGAVEVIKRVLPQFRKQKSGHILNISSIAGLRAASVTTVYNASKFALEAFNEGLADELAEIPVKMTAIEPGRGNESKYTLFGC